MGIEGEVMRMLSFLLVHVCVFLLLYADQAMAGCHSSASNLCCRGWLNGRYDGEKSGDTRGNPRETSRDKIGIKGQCSDYFPTWGERTKLERTSDDPFTARYEVTRQYCWARFVLAGSPNCGGPRIDWCHEWIFYYPCGWDWDDPNYVSWGDTKRRSVSLEDLGGVCKNGVCQGGDCTTVTMLSGVNQSEICLFLPRQEYKHGGTNGSKKSKVCAYYKPWMFSGIIGIKDYSNNLIGCVDVPFNPAPNVFNPSIPSGTEPRVEVELDIHNLMKTYGSSFDQPTVVMSAKQMDLSTNIAVEEQLVLRYRFKGDTYVYPVSSVPFSTAPVCGYFYKLKTKYCAFIPEDQQNKVCVCQGLEDKDECMAQDSLGCVARPSMSQSDISITGEYTVWIDELGNQAPAISISLIHNHDIKKKLPLPLEATPLVIPEYYIKPGDVVRDKSGQAVKDKDGNIVITYVMSKGSGSLYGLIFSSIIPKFNEKGEIQTIKAVSAESNNALHKCPVCTLSYDPSYPDSFVYEGQRDASFCCSDSIADEDKNQQCKIPPHPESCPIVQGAAINLEPNTDAENAICPGIYQGPIDNTDDPAKIAKPDKICVIYEDPWNEYKVSAAPYCVDMPQDCLSIDTPSASSGFATWTQSTSGNAEDGICDATYGFTNKEELLFSCQDCEQATVDKVENDTETPSSTPSVRADIVAKTKVLANLKSIYKSLQAILGILNTNVSLSSLEALSNLSAADLAQYVTTQESHPQNQCKGNIFHKGIQGMCSRIDSCLAINKPAPANGNMTVPDSSHAWETGKTDTESSDVYTIGNQNISVMSSIIQIEGKCPKGYKESKGGAPKLQCVSRYIIKNGKKILLTQAWGFPSNVCLVAPESK